jgi:hypothetical protein
MLGGSLSPKHGTSLGCGWRNSLQLWRVAANMLNKQLLIHRPQAWGLGVGLTTLHHKKYICYDNFYRAWTWTDSLDK